MNNKISRNILIDEPVKEDEFTGGGHLRTAKALASTIRQFDGQNRAVGLEGAWGAGKSTIVELARKELKDESSDKHFSVFTFDLWTHQTSNFKRSMLETLLTWIEAQEGISKKIIGDIEEIRNEVRDKVIDTKIKNRKIFDIFGIAFILFAFTLPFIYQWLSPSVIMPSLSIKDNSVYYIHNSMPVASIISILLIISMVIFSIVRFVRFYNKSKFKIVKDRITDAASATLAIFSKDAEITHERKTIKEINPSQEEFYETFQRILSLYQTKQNRLVIVIDNIDRIPDDRLPDAWSDIRSMVVGQVINPAHEQFITLIVPYDRHHVLAALKSGGNQEGDVIRKSFDAVFQVSAPIVSDASKYFQVKFHEALPSLSDLDIAYQVFKIFEYSIRDQGKPSTPRQMLSYINGVTLLWEQWEGEIDLVSVAVFVAYSKKLYSQPELLRDATTIDRRYRDLARSKDLDKFLAALAYNVSPELALQVLLHTEIANAFTQEKIEAVVEISTAPGFLEIMPDVFADHADEWSKEGVAYLGLVAKNLATINIPMSIKLAARGELFKSIKSLPYLKPAEWEDAKNISFMIDLCDEDQVAFIVADLDKWLQTSFTLIGGLTFEHGSYWIRVLAGILSRIDSVFKDEALSKAVNSKITVFNQPDFILGAAYYADTTDFHIADFNFTKPLGILEELSAIMVDNAQQFKDIWPEVIHLMSGDAVSLLTALSTHLSQIDYSDEESEEYVLHVLNLCKLLVSVSAFEKAPSEMHELIADGTLYKSMKALHDKDGASNAEFLANAFWLVIKKFGAAALPLDYMYNHRLGDLSEHGAWVQEVIRGGSIEQDIVDKIANLVISDGRIGTIISQNAQAPESTILYGEILVSIAKNDKIHSPSVAIFINNYDFLKNSLGGHVEGFLKVVGQNNSREDFDKLLVEQLSLQLVRDISLRTEAGWKSLLRKIDDWLSDLNSDEWDSVLKSEDGAFYLLAERVNSADIRIKPESLKEPLISHVLNLALEKIDTDHSFDFIYSLFSKNIQRGFAKDLFERIEGKNVTVIGFERLWKRHKLLITNAKFEDSPDIVIRKLIIPAVQSNLSDTLDFFRSNQKSLREAVNLAEEEVRDELLDYILSRIETSSESESDRKLIDQAASYLGVVEVVASLQKQKQKQKQSSDEPVADREVS